MIPILDVYGPMVGIGTFTLGFGKFTMLDTTNPSLDYTVCMLPILDVQGPTVGIGTFTLGVGEFTILDTTNPSLDYTDLQYCVHDHNIGYAGRVPWSVFCTYTLGGIRSVHNARYYQPKQYILGVLDSHINEC